MTRIVDVIYALCEERELTIAELERIMQFSKSSISKWIDHDPPVSKIVKIANYFDVPVDYIVQYDKFTAGIIGHTHFYHHILGNEGIVFTFKDLISIQFAMSLLEEPNEKVSV